jgi:DNA-binding transcriptional MerR regulator
MSGVTMSGKKRRDVSRSETSEKVGHYIGEVAEILGVSPTMVRYWEKHGLISPSRTDSGYRVYPHEEVSRMKQIRDLVKSGVNTAGIKHALPELRAKQSSQGSSSPALLRGVKLQRLRHARKISLRSLGAATQLSPSYISAIERSVSQPSFSVLLKLANALGTNTISLLGGDFVPDKLVVKEAERRPLDLNIQGIEIQQLFLVDSVLESLLFLISPGVNSGESIQHAGEEFLFILQGRLDIVLDETEEYTLETGDSMTFASHRPHRYGNPGTVVTKILWVNTPPTF